MLKKAIQMNQQLKDLSTNIMKVIKLSNQKKLVKTNDLVFDLNLKENQKKIDDQKLEKNNQLLQLWLNMIVQKLMILTHQEMIKFLCTTNDVSPL